MIVAWIIVAILMIAIFGQFVHRRNRIYSFYLTDCYQGQQIIILAHHFKNKKGRFIFYDGWGNVLFYSNISWTNVYRGREL